MKAPKLQLPLVLRFGQFYRGDERVPLAFGDVEQIQLIKLLQSKQQQGECFLPQVREEGGFRIDFRCHCCNEECLGIIHVATDAKLIGKVVKCDKCGTPHKIHVLDELLGPLYLKVQ